LTVTGRPRLEGAGRRRPHPDRGERLELEDLQPGVPA
jgi:hypothetical protein